MKKISVIGLWRDSSSYIDRTLSQLDDLLSIPNFDFSFYFYENDSIDNTKDIIQKWKNNKNCTTVHEILKTPKYGSVTTVNRLILLSIYRNKLHDMISNDHSDLTLMIDTDIIFSKDHFLHLYDKISELNSAMVCSNTRQIGIRDCISDPPSSEDSFYDVFALRDKYSNYCLYFSDCPVPLQDDREKWFRNIPVKINAGFSGFSLIKTSILQQCRWSTCGHSEHINFCTQVREYGDIHIIPDCKTITKIDISTVTDEAYNQVKIQQRKILLNMNKVYNTSIKHTL